MAFMRKQHKTGTGGKLQNNDRPLTLSELPLHQQAEILYIGPGVFSAKLLNLGFLPGQRLSKVRYSAFGNAVYIQLENIQVALRLSETSHIYIKNIDA